MYNTVVSGWTGYVVHMKESRRARVCFYRRHTVGAVYPEVYF